MMTLTVKIVLAFVAVAIVALVIKLITGRNKRHADKTTGEKVASQFSTKISSTINNMLEGARTPEAIKEELLAKLKTTKSKLREEFKKYLTELLTTMATHKKLIANNELRVKDLTKKAKEYKNQFLETNDEKYKSYANRIISQLISIEKLVESSKQIVNDCTVQKEEAEINYDLLIGELETKHAEIIAMTMNPEVSFQLSTMDITDLTAEFKQKLSQRSIQTQVSNIVNKDETISTTTNVSSGELDEYFDKL